METCYRWQRSIELCRILFCTQCVVILRFIAALASFFVCFFCSYYFFVPFQLPIEIDEWRKKNTPTTNHMCGKDMPSYEHLHRILNYNVIVLAMSYVNYVEIKYCIIFVAFSISLFVRDLLVHCIVNGIRWQNLLVCIRTMTYKAFSNNYTALEMATKSILTTILFHSCE